MKPSAPLSATGSPRETPAKQRIVSIQVCRGLAAIVVVLAHLHNVEAKYFSTHLLRPFQFGVLGVDLFFVISGVVISLVTVGKFGDVRNAGRFLYHRLARIYPVYWVYCLAVFAVFLYHPQWINAGSGHQVHLAQSFLLLPDALPLLVMQGWTLTYEIYFYVVFFVLLLLPGRFTPWLLVLWGVFVAITASLQMGLDSPLMALLTSPSVFEFLFGCVLYRIYRRFHLRPAVGAVLVAVSLVWLGAVAVWTWRFHQFDQHWIEYSLWLRPALYGSFSALLLLGLMELERSKLVRFSLTLQAIGDWSFSIYLSHLIVVELLGRPLAKLLPNSAFAVPLLVVVGLPVALLAGYLSYTWIEQPLLRVFYRPSLPQQNATVNAVLAK